MASLQRLLLYNKCNGGSEDLDERPRKRSRTSSAVPSSISAVTRSVGDTLEGLNSLFTGLRTYELGGQPDEGGIKQQVANEEANLVHAETYDKWKAAAIELDRLDGSDVWKEVTTSDDYNVHIVQTRLTDLKDALHSRDYDRMRYLVRTALTRDLGGMGNASLYKHSRIGTKRLIEDYIQTVSDVIDTIVYESGTGSLSGEHHRALHEELKRARQSFGRSALLLSGGGTLGMNHIGVVKALYEVNLLPRIISGASAGSIVAAVLGTKKNDELQGALEEFSKGDLDVFSAKDNPDGVWQIVQRFLRQGFWYDDSHLRRVMEDLLGDMTFLEAYNRSQRILNICVSTEGAYEMARLLNYVTAPHVIIVSAVCASCAVPSIFKASTLKAKDARTREITDWDLSQIRWIDGSVDNDLPITRLAEMFNVNHFIVSQVNPHVVPFLDRERGEGFASILGRDPPWLHSIANLAKGEALHRMHVLADLGIFPNAMNKARSVLGQRYVGDITIMPPISSTEVVQALTNPTEDFVKNASRNGERATWPKINLIKNRLAIELKLDSAI
ncbi:hypothetical protein BAUCODRAFT_111313, partial [Baudoinia panamericana UAMH 10762]